MVGLLLSQNLLLLMEGLLLEHQMDQISTEVHLNHPLVPSQELQMDQPLERQQLEEEKVVEVLSPNHRLQEEELMGQIPLHPPTLTPMGK
jgi:hypothetical protein